MGASHLFSTFITPSPPYTCGGGGRGEEETPLPPCGRHSLREGGVPRRPNSSEKAGLAESELCKSGPLCALLAPSGRNSPSVGPSGFVVDHNQFRGAYASRPASEAPGNLN